MEARNIERRFLQTPGDAYALYQLKDSLENVSLRYESHSSVTQKMGLSVESANYEPMYTGVIAMEKRSSIPVILEELFVKFNLGRPYDFKGHSLSVSDVIVLKLNDQVTTYYVDTIGFQELHGFRDRGKFLKNAQRAMEDDHGIFPINKDRRDEQESKKSVLKMLKTESTEKLPQKDGKIQKPRKEMER